MLIGNPLLWPIRLQGYSRTLKITLFVNSSASSGFAGLTGDVTTELQQLSKAISQLLAKLDQQSTPAAAGADSPVSHAAKVAPTSPLKDVAKAAAPPKASPSTLGAFDPLAGSPPKKDPPKPAAAPAAPTASAPSPASVTAPPQAYSQQQQQQQYYSRAAPTAAAAAPSYSHQQQAGDQRYQQQGVQPPTATAGYQQGAAAAAATGSTGYSQQAQATGYQQPAQATASYGQPTTTAATATGQPAAASQQYGGSYEQQQLAGFSANAMAQPPQSSPAGYQQPGYAMTLTSIWATHPSALASTNAVNTVPCRVVYITLFACVVLIGVLSAALCPNRGPLQVPAGAV